MGYGLIAFFVIFIVLVIWIYNRLVSARQLVNNGWSDIEVQLKRRADLIPQIVDTVKAYAGHEKNLFEDVVHKRNQALSADGLGNRATAESALSGPLGRLLAIAEDYPDGSAMNSMVSNISSGVSSAAPQSSSSSGGGGGGFSGGGGGGGGGGGW